jgi:hypothetical protein
VTDSSGSPITAADGTLLGYCAGISSAGQICGVVGLSFCDPSLSCVFFVDGANDGVCFAPCAPPSDAACTTPNECLAVFADPTVGICAIPQPADAGCVQAEGLFCPEGQICLDPGDGGACFERCTPGPTDTCPGTQSCLAPTTDGTVGICAQAEQPGGPCNPNAGEFCDSAGLCILEADGGATCHQTCTQTQPTCPTGQTCLPIEGSPLDACG